jgi:hypothetical protein
VGGEGLGRTFEQLWELRRMEVLPSAAIEWSEETWWTIAGRRRR